MDNLLGEIIFRSRRATDLTQDEYGAKYNVSGPAIFKFEKGFVRPSLDLWLQMAKDADVTERRAVLLWLKSKLPVKYQGYIELPGGTGAEETGGQTRSRRSTKAAQDYASYDSRAAMREAASRDKSLSKGLLDLLHDDDLWAQFKPTGHEVNLVRDMFGPLGRGSKTAYREALRLVREFTHSF